MNAPHRCRVPVRLGLAACLLVTMGAFTVLLDGCGSGHNQSFKAETPNRPPFILPGGIDVEPPRICTPFLNPCTGADEVALIPAVTITYDVIDLEDLCGAAFHWFSTDNGRTYVPAYESTYRPAGAPSPSCAALPDTDDCTPCLPVIPSGSSSAGASVMEPDNHVFPTCMSSLGGGGQVNRFYWDVFRNQVGYPTPTQVIYCISPTDPVNFITQEIYLRNVEALDDPEALTAAIDYELFREQLQNDPTRPGFFCTDSFLVSSPHTMVGITPDGITEIRVGSSGRDFDVPIHISNVNTCGPTCFYVGVAFDPERMGFRYLASADYAAGILPTSEDLVQGTPLLVTNGGTATLISPPPESINGDEDFVVIQVTSPVPLVGGDLFQMFFRAYPLPPGETAAVALVETIPVDNGFCADNPASCTDRGDWEVPELEYRGTTTETGAADPCDGVDYPFIPEPPIAITFIQNSEPECCIPPLDASDLRGIDLSVAYWLADFESDPIFITPEFSTDGGLTWARMTETIADPLSEGTTFLTSAPGEPCPPGPGTDPCGEPGCPDDFYGALQHFFVWDLTTDLPAGSGFICDIRVRITPDDGASVGVGCEVRVPFFFNGAEMIVRRRDDPTYVVNDLIALDSGGRPVILPQLPDHDYVEVFAVALNGEEIEVTDSVVFTSSDPVTIDVFYDGAADAADVVNDPTVLAPPNPSPPTALPPCPIRNEIGNQCVMVGMVFNGFLVPPEDECLVDFFDPTGATIPVELTGQFAACTDLGGPDYDGDRRPYMALGDIDAGIPGLPSGPAIPGVGGLMDVTFYADVEAQDLGAYSVNLQWDPTVLGFVDIFVSPFVPNMVANTTAVADVPLATLQWNNFTAVTGLTGVVELETVRYTLLCGPGLCSTPFYLTIDALADPGVTDIGAFIGGAADSATDCFAEFQVP